MHGLGTREHIPFIEKFSERELYLGEPNYAFLSYYISQRIVHVYK